MPYIKLFLVSPPRLELGTLCVLGTRDNHYTTVTVDVLICDKKHVCKLLHDSVWFDPCAAVTPSSPLQTVVKQ